MKRADPMNQTKWNHSIFYFILTFLISFYLCSCGDRDSLTPPFHAQVLIQVPKDSSKLSSDEPQFKIETVKFNHLENLETLSGKYYEFRSGGTLAFVNNGIGTVLQESETTRPHLRYKIINQVIVPQDNYTLFILSEAYQFDYILTQLHSLTGIHPDELIKDRGRLKVFFHSRILQTKNDGIVIREKEGAIYTNLHSFVFLKPESKLEQVPYSMNLSVISHEFGHLLFEYITTQFNDNLPLAQFNDSDEYRGFNEGFSDLFSFIVTGNTNPLLGTHSTKNTSVQNRKNSKKLRQRDFSDVDFNLNTLIKCKNKFYCYGTLFANAYYNVYLELGFSPLDPNQRAASFTEFVQIFMETSQNINKMKLADLKSKRSEPLNSIFYSLIQYGRSQNFNDLLKTHLNKNFAYRLNDMYRK